MVDNTVSRFSREAVNDAVNRWEPMSLTQTEQELFRFATTSNGEQGEGVENLA